MHGKNIIINLSLGPKVVSNGVEYYHLDTHTLITVDAWNKAIKEHGKDVVSFQHEIKDDYGASVQATLEAQLNSYNVINRQARIVISPPDDIIPCWNVLVNTEIEHECKTEREAWEWVANAALAIVSKLQ